MSQSYFEITYRGPWTGIDVSMPENLIAPTSTPFAINCLLKNGEIKTRPQLYPTILLPGASPLQNLANFIDANDGKHVVAFTTTGLYELDPAWQTNQTWNARGVWGGVSILPWAFISFLRKLYFTRQDSAFGIALWDGSAGTYVNVTTFTSGRYLMELANHLIVGYTDEGTVTPYRIRWSASGNPSQFNPAIDITAGLNDLLDVSDSITGLMSVGKIGFIFRSNGVSTMTPTGIGSNPFDFNHLWSSQNGIGQVLPSSIASYGSVGVFISSDDVYSVTSNSFNNIGNQAFDGITNDLLLYANLKPGFWLSTLVPNAGIQACIVPKYSDNLVYLQYHLNIPTKNGTIIWKYSFKDNSWTRDILNNYIVTSPPLYISVAS